VREAADALERTEERAKELEFEKLYCEHKGRVFSTVYRLVGNRPDAEDVTQDVFVKVYKNLESFRGESAISTWIYRITVNTCFDFLRKRKRQAAISLEECAEPSTGPQGLKQLVETMAAKLPDAYRKVFVLYDIQGLKHAEIAETLGITEGASKSLLHRARARLRQRLGPYVKGWHNR
jgi:RNA polymerase sigma-70 factor (ECF subfamily)